MKEINITKKTGLEASAKRFKDLKKTFEGNDKVIKLNRFAGLGADDNLDKILEDTPIPNDFDLLSIDVDGNDYTRRKLGKLYRRYLKTRS